LEETGYRLTKHNEPRPLGWLPWVLDQKSHLAFREQLKISALHIIWVFELWEEKDEHEAETLEDWIIRNL
jgi:hypothetical protein